MSELSGRGATTALAVVDASVVVKWFVVEVSSEKALELRDRYVSGEVKLLAPELLLLEVLNALRFKEFFTLHELKEIAECLDAYGFELYPVRGEYASKTPEVALKSGITVHDASYVSLALLKNAALYTADMKLAEKLEDRYPAHVRVLR